MTQPGYPPAPLSGLSPGYIEQAAGITWVRALADKINQILRGKLNVVTTVTLTPGATSTIVSDPRISAFNALIFSPTTASAATALAGLYVSMQVSGSATLHHASSGASDQIFILTILG